jgi:CHASE2 domain-containing sensor protein
MGRRVFSVVNGVWAALFVVSAALQYDDPDPIRWALLYVAAAVACVVSLRVRHGRYLAALVGFAALAWAITLSGVLPELRIGDLFRSMKADQPRIEQGRELIGLLIVFAWMAVLVLAHRRRSPAR